MELESPIRDRQGNITIQIAVVENLITHYSSTSKTPVPDTTSELMMYCGEIARYFEGYSVKWFPSPILSAQFLKQIIHAWNYNFTPPPTYFEEGQTITVRQIWCPEKIHMLHGKITIHWKLVKGEYSTAPVSSGREEINEIPYSTEVEPFEIKLSLRSILKQKIRRARIKTVTAKWKLTKLTEMYYTKYGTLEGIDRDSNLSSEIDSDIDSSAKI
jgi:hypothetical protein